MENMKELNLEQIGQVAGGVLTENDKRLLRALIIRAKKDPDKNDPTTFVNSDWGFDLTYEMMDYVMEVWDHVN